MMRRVAFSALRRLGDGKVLARCSDTSTRCSSISTQCSSMLARCSFDTPTHSSNPSTHSSITSTHPSNSVPSTPLTVIDPFCGSGTLLQEFASFVKGDGPVSQRQRLVPESSELWLFSSFSTLVSPTFPSLRSSRFPVLSIPGRGLATAK